MPPFLSAKGGHAADGAAGWGDDAVCFNRLVHVPGERSVADLFTKALPAANHCWCVERAHMVAVPESVYRYVPPKTYMP